MKTDKTLKYVYQSVTMIYLLLAFRCSRGLSKRQRFLENAWLVLVLNSLCVCVCFPLHQWKMSLTVGWIQTWRQLVHAVRAAPVIVYLPFSDFHVTDYNAAFLQTDFGVKQQGGFLFKVLLKGWEDTDVQFQGVSLKIKSTLL